MFQCTKFQQVVNKPVPSRLCVSYIFMLCCPLLARSEVSASRILILPLGQVGTILVS